MSTIPVPDKQSLEVAYERRGTVQGVADEFNVSKTTATKWMKRRGVQLALRGKSARIPMPDWREFQRLYYSINNTQALADHYGVSTSTIRKWRIALLEA